MTERTESQIHGRPLVDVAKNAWIEAYRETQQQSAQAHQDFQKVMWQAHAAYLKNIEQGFKGLAAMVAQEHAFPMPAPETMAAPTAQAETIVDAKTEQNDLTTEDGRQGANANSGLNNLVVTQEAIQNFEVATDDELEALRHEVFGSHAFQAQPEISAPPHETELANIPLVDAVNLSAMTGPDLDLLAEIEKKKMIFPII